MTSTGRANDLGEFLFQTFSTETKSTITAGHVLEITQNLRKSLDTMLFQTFQPRLPQRRQLSSAFVDTHGRDTRLGVVIPTFLHRLLQRLDRLQSTTTSLNSRHRSQWLRSISHMHDS